MSGTGHAVSGPVLPAILKAPAGTAAPQVSGGTDPGATLSCSPGTWAGDVLESLLYRAPESLAYQWTRDGTDLPGAAETNSITADPEGNYRCRVTATNAAGATSQTSSAHAIDAHPARDDDQLRPQQHDQPTTIRASPSSPEPGATFECRLDGPGATTGTFGSCTQPQALHRPRRRRLHLPGPSDRRGLQPRPEPRSRSFTVDTDPARHDDQLRPQRPTATTIRPSPSAPRPERASNAGSTAPAPRPARSPPAPTRSPIPTLPTATTPSRSERSTPSTTPTRPRRPAASPSTRPRPTPPRP